MAFDALNNFVSIILIGFGFTAFAKFWSDKDRVKMIWSAYFIYVFFGLYVTLQCVKYYTKEPETESTKASPNSPPVPSISPRSTKGDIDQTFDFSPTGFVAFLPQPLGSDLKGDTIIPIAPPLKLLHKWDGSPANFLTKSFVLTNTTTATATHLEKEVKVDSINQPNEVASGISMNIDWDVQRTLQPKSSMHFGIPQGMVDASRLDLLNRFECHITLTGEIGVNRVPTGLGYEYSFADTGERVKFKYNWRILGEKDADGKFKLHSEGIYPR